MTNSSRSIRIISTVALVGALIIEFAFILQGIEFTDSGYWATNYNVLFSNPESISSSFSGVYFTIFLGACWLKLTSWMGLLGLRVGYYLVILLTGLLAFKILKLVYGFSYPVITSAMLVTLFYCTNDMQGELCWLSYNDLSALFYTIAIFLILKGNESSKWYTLLAGVILGMNTFLRLPNILGLLLPLLLLGYECSKGFWKRGIRDGGTCALGFLIGIGTVLLIMVLMGHLPFFLSSFDLLIESGRSQQGSHGVWKLLSRFIKDHFDSLKVGISVCFLWVLTLIGGLGLQERKNLPLILVISIAVLLGLTVSLFLDKYVRWMFPDLWAWTLTGVPFLFLIPRIFVLSRPFKAFLNSAEAQREVLLILLSLTCLLIGPLGSDRAILNYRFYMWIPLGLLCCLLCQMQELKCGLLRMSKVGLVFVKVMVVSSICLLGLIDKFHTVFRDNQNRLQLIHTVDHLKLRGLLTTKERSKEIMDLLSNCNRFIAPGTAVLAFENIPMVNYLTDSVPFLNNPNPQYYLIEQFREIIKRSSPQNGYSLPVIVNAKVEISDPWPQKMELLIHPDNKIQETYSEMRALIEDYKMSNGYVLVWESDSFQIWSPKPG